MPAARPLKRRATPSAGSGNPPSNHSFQLTFASPSSLLSQLPSVASGQTALALQTTISFAPNITPGTYEAPPPSDEDILGAEDESSHSALFPNASAQELASLPSQPASKRRRRTTPASASRATPIPSKSSTKKMSSSSSKPSSPAPDSDSSPLPNSTDTQGHIPRPPNAFILFRSSFIRSQHISAETEGNHGTLSKIVGMLWHALSYEERQVWQTKARRAYAEHKKKYPGYSFRPVKDKSSTAASANSSRLEREGTPASSSDAPMPKRKTRAVEPRDLERCEHIAALYARGLKGSDLDAAMREFDAARKPQTITPRFEAPLTAQAYAPPKEEMREVKVEKEDVEESSISCRATTVEPTKQAQQPPSQTDTQTREHAPATTDIRPRRVRRSSSAPLLDAGVPISAPAPLYPASNTYFLQTHHQPQPLQPFDHQIQHQESEDAFRYESSTHQYQSGQQQTYTSSFAYPQIHMHIPQLQDMTGLRKRSASSSPRLRRSSHAFGYPPINSNFFAHQMTVPYQHHEPETQEPQPLPHAYGAAHPHLQRMQAQMQAQMQSHPESQSASIGLGLEFDRPGMQPSYDAGGSLSRQSTLTDISSTEESSSNGYWNESVDFSGFSFSASHGRESQTPVSTQPTHPGPFEAPTLSTAPSIASVDELQSTYADMPCLVEQPLYQDFFQPTARVSQPPQLEIQTSWNSEEFSFDAEPGSAASVPPSSAVELESVPTSAVSGVFDFPPPTSTLDLQNGYMDYPAPPQSANAPTPCSPDSQSMSSAGVRTPIDETYVNWDHSCSTPAAAASSPVAGFDVCSPATTDDDALTRARTLALQAGFRAYLAHAEKMGAMDNTDGAFEQFVRFVQNQGVGGGGGMRNNGGMVFESSMSQAQMANVM